MPRRPCLGARGAFSGGRFAPGWDVTLTFTLTMARRRRARRSSTQSQRRRQTQLADDARAAAVSAPFVSIAAGLGRLASLRLDDQVHRSLLADGAFRVCESGTGSRPAPGERKQACPQEASPLHHQGSHRGALCWALDILSGLCCPRQWLRAAGQWLRAAGQAQPAAAAAKPQSADHCPEHTPFRGVLSSRKRPWWMILTCPINGTSIPAARENPGV